MHNKDDNPPGQHQKMRKSSEKAASSEIHPSWFHLIRYCEELQYGELTKLQIQNGLPTSAEYVKKKIKFL